MIQDLKLNIVWKSVMVMGTGYIGTVTSAFLVWNHVKVGQGGILETSSERHEQPTSQMLWMVLQKERVFSRKELKYKGKGLEEGALLREAKSGLNRSSLHKQGSYHTGAA